MFVFRFGKIILLIDLIKVRSKTCTRASLLFNDGLMCFERVRLLLSGFYKLVRDESVSDD